MDRLIQLIKTHQQKIKAWSQQRQLRPTFWAAVGTALVVGLLIIWALIQAFFSQPTYRAQDYAPFTSLQEYQQFITDNPLYLAPEPQTRAFNLTRQIRSDKQAIYIFQLSAPSLRPTMTEAQTTSYHQALKHSQQQALDWIKSQDIDPQTLNLIWRPNPEELP